MSSAVQLGTLNASNYPPYNIIKESETIWKIEVAVAGFDESELGC
jgi:HSP20 family molecular chaperone IbpA